jgi:hypothetical protein
MIQITIRCHPLAPVSVAELEPRLDSQVTNLRAQVTRGTVRLSRLIQELPNLDLGVGWILELEMPADEPFLTQGGLVRLASDMRMLGLQTTMLSPFDLSDSIFGVAAASSELSSSRS